MTTTSSADISTVTRRDLLRSVGVVGLAVLGAACAPLAPGAAAPTSSAASVSTPSTPRSGGTLRMGIIGDYPTLEGETVAPISQDNLWGVWDRLIAQDVTTQPRPMLAESWDVSPDHTQITFHLRQGVKFHTGRELTSDDVKFSLQRLQDPKVASSMLGRSRTMSAWDTPDRYTIVVTANRPWPDAFDLIQYVNIIDPETFASAGLATPVGTGPFKFQEYQQGDHLTLVKNPDYWMTGRPYLDRIVTSVFSNSQSAITQLEAGALDVVDAPPVVDTVRLATDAQYQVLVNNVTGGFWNVLPNCQKEPT
ncbi:MAG: ABC transporter substrate-binding protein, partial [Chloroflexi bacterium]|nr:ABC transporter substrate-binding protein [Chloroflexota bacterium]